MRFCGSRSRLLNADTVSVLYLMYVQAVQVADAHCLCGEYSSRGISVTVWEGPVSHAHCRCLLRTVASPSAEIPKEHVQWQLVLKLSPLMAYMYTPCKWAHCNAMSVLCCLAHPTAVIPRNQSSSSMPSKFNIGCAHVSQGCGLCLLFVELSFKWCVHVHSCMCS